MVFPHLDKKLSALVLCLLLAPAADMAAAEQRWYSEAQVTQGEPLYRQNCAVCHGPNGEATPDWKKTDANGNYPPPPLNGSAHTWHHDLDLLRRTIREGGGKYGGQMPGFEAVLDAAQIDSIIAFFQSRWPDEIYARWAENFEISALPSLDDIVTANNESLTRLLRQRLGDVQIDDVTQTSVEGLWQVQMGNRYVYILGNGKYALTGDLVNLENGRNLTESSRRATIVETLAEFEQRDFVVFPAAGETRATLTVFTDTACPYCRKLHAEIGELQRAGITVRYLPLSRGGAEGPGYELLKSVWCADDRGRAMTEAKNNRVDALPPGDCAQAAVVDRGYLAGRQVGIRATPALIKRNGEKIEGYVPFRELIPQLLR